ncbi:MAG TPA: MMPL family transporter [bacterium]|nr:MMPL family transporter [bacterium]
MDKFWGFYLSLLFRYSWGVFFLFTLLFVGELLYVRGNFRIDSDLRALFHGENQTVKDLEYLDSRLGGYATAQIVVRSESYENNLAFLTALKKDLESFPDIRFVEFERDITYLEERALLLLPTERLIEAEQKVREAVANEVEKGLSLDDAPAADRADDKMPHALSDEIDRVLKEIERQKLAYNISPYYIAQGGKYVEMKVRPAGSDTTIEDIKRIVTLLDERVAATGPDTYGIAVEVGGYYRHRLEEIQAINSNLVASLVACILLLLMVTVLFFRTPFSVPIIFLPLSFGVMFGIIAALWVIGKFNLISAFTIAMLYGLGIDYAIHLYSRYGEFRREGLPPLDAMRNTYEHLFRPLLYSTVTTAIAFLSLIFIEFKGFSDFGIVAGVGIISSLVAILFLFPAIVFLIEQWTPLTHAPRGVSNLAPAYQIFLRRPIFMIIPATILIASFIALFLVRFEYNIDNLSFKRKYSPDSIIARYNDLVRDENPNTMAASMPAIITTDSIEEMYDATRALYRKKQELSDLQHEIRIGGILSMANFVPEGQEEKLQIMKRILRVIERKKELMDDKTAERFEREIRPLLSISSPITAEELPKWIQDKLREKDGSYGKIISFVTSGNKSDINKVLTIRKELGTIRGERGEYRTRATFLLLADIKHVLEHELPRAILLSFFSVLAVLVLAFRSFRQAGIILAPLFAGITLMIGIIHFSGFSFNLFNMVVIPTIIGIGIDSCIHIYDRFRSTGFTDVAGTMRTTGAAVLISSVTTLIGFVSIIFGAHKGVTSIGTVSSIGIVSVTLCALILFPLLLSFISRRRTGGS